ncbi:glycosyltransferase [Saccharolobus solfataricus]|uniref:Glycosyltransferase n=3 Tax=Saccharolobus solfataricus TaxID=2287 RepID=A0A0E3KA74_SACSO|nr:glycosyltransferase [Saccharolobus solfataricus]AAK42667.1 Glucan phosphorylase, putative (glgP or malP) [Saccharolobus solfataricus P2]AKA72763.1 glycosyltransferase [Saccharolobus solfataricus]AKA75462.1 glycosyltransferase [Saccharolobus solfataricus]AKA78155.1 glycosyltransferase [Saccharolobus solfataricus]AZF67274.1 glycosyltransferase [Saccharolobus solfataricus]
MIVSVTAEIGLDIGQNFAGGLGILEGDKFYAAARLGINYTVITLLYRRGYADGEGKQRELLSHLNKEWENEITVGDQRIMVEYLAYTLNTAKVIFANPLNTNLNDQLYVENSNDERFYKCLLLAKVAENYISERIGWDKVKFVDMQEACPAFLPLLRYFPRYRIVVHTPAPWGHPTFPSHLFKKEFSFEFPLDHVVMTDIGLSASIEGIVVSKKMLKHVSRTFPQHMHKIRAVTNGIEISRWRNPSLNMVKDLDDFMKKRIEVKRDSIKKLGKDTDKPTIAWLRRITGYKRPDFILRLIDDLKDDVFFIIGGLAHPKDYSAVEIERKFKEISDKRNNVIYIRGADANFMKLAIWASDIWTFTPYSGWEASGTSFMKAGINGIPSVASRDGAVTEIINDGYNGWLYGEDRDILLPFNVYDDNKEYEEFINKIKVALNKYYEVGYNAYKTFPAFCSIDRLMKEYGYY